MISRDEAAKIATSYAISNGLVISVYDVRLGADIARQPAYLPCSLNNCWIAYIEHFEPLMLRSSTIVAVDRKTGNIVYGGSADDEG